MSVAGASRATTALNEMLGTLRRYGPGGSQSLGEQLATNRNVIRFAIGEANHPRRFLAGLGAYRDALARQEALFTTQRVDDITDAMRHANASALVVERVHRSGAPLDTAADFMRRLGRAHEADSQLTGANRAASEAMDLHNNELGISLAIAHARLPGAGSATNAASEQALEGAVLRALAGGRGLVLDAPAAVPRPSTAQELRAVLRDPRLVA